MAAAGRVAYASLLCDDGFLPGALALASSLRRRCPSLSPGGSPRADLVLLVTPGVSRAARARAGGMFDELLEVDDVPLPSEWGGGGERVGAWARSGLTKLRVWGLVAYRRVVYIDADAIVLDSIDELFERAAAFAAAPDTFPPDKFNAGVMVLTPSQAVLERMLAAAPTTASHDGGDTGFLNSFFPDWWGGDDPSARLPFRYNAQRTMYWLTHKTAPGYWEAVKPIKILHFSSSPKPWDTAKGGWRGDLEAIWLAEYTAAATGAAAAATAAPGTDAGGRSELAGLRALCGAFLEPT